MYITPSGSVTVTGSDTKQFICTGLVNTDDIVFITSAVTWNLIGTGSIDASGLYTGDSSGGTATLTATYGSINSSNTVNIVITSSLTSEIIYKIIDTAQSKYYSESGQEITAPSEGESYYGQDAQYSGNTPSYTNNNDGTITDNVTGLMWQKDPGSKKTWQVAMSDSASFNLAGYTDWRLPSIKELYSLILFNGTDPSGYEEEDTSFLVPFLDSNYFDFQFGNTSAGERLIDAQYASSTKYVSTTMDGDETVFGVNFADGRIKGYPIYDKLSQTDKTFFVLYVRGDTNYGINKFVDNGDSTITDSATGLMWMQKDSGHLGVGNSSDGKLTWTQALAWAESLDFAGYSDWRLPNAKELQSIVDYTRSPKTSNSAAIDPVFSTTSITDEGGGTNYPFYWTSTTHANWSDALPDANAAYIAFGEALGWMQPPQPPGANYVLFDVHGAGAQRSDPKIGDPGDYPNGHGPQGDVIRIYNFARCIRDVE